MEDKKCLYEAIPEVDFPQKTPLRDAEVYELQAKAPYIDLLIMTVTEIEQKAVLSEMDPWPGQKEILEGAIKINTYRFGQFGRYRSAQVGSTMGDPGRAGARATLQDAIIELKPKAIILIGIAFGINRRKQHLGDVIIAESVFNYSLKRIGEKGSILRGEETHCGLILSNLFRTRRHDWKLPCGNRFVKVHQGLLLSGPKLVDNQEFRDSLVKEFASREPLGGEMEGAGAYEAAEREKVEIILVKGICDWADGLKNDRAQSFAAFSAVSLAKHVLIKPHVLAELRAKDVPYPPSPIIDPVPSPAPGYKPIIMALKNGSLVPFLGSGINPNFYIDLARQFTNMLVQDLDINGGFFHENDPYTQKSQKFIEILKRQELIKKLIGIPCSLCPYWLMDRPEECPIRENIETGSCCSLRIGQELAVSRMNMRAFSHYYIRTQSSIIALYNKLYDIFQEIECKDSQALHAFLATLPDLMYSNGIPRRSPGLPYQLIVTTNYDDMLEKVFKKKGQRVDIVFYVADGDDRGHFKHKSFEGNVKPIDTKDYKELPLRSPWGNAKQPRPIILKLFGTCDRETESQFITTEDHLTLLLNNLAEKLPTSLMSVLHQSSILFMGYTPSDTDLDRIVHCLWSPAHRMQANKSWLLHEAQPGEIEKAIWDTRNTELRKIPTSLDNFVTELEEGIKKQITALEEVEK
jgi:nucleoside phosphorylase